MRITMIGHSTVLIEIGGVRIITDPYFGSWGNVAYARTTAPAVSRGDVPEVDAVLLSHLHWDHVDRRYLRHLDPSTPVIAPALVRRMARLRGARSVLGLWPWGRTRVGAVDIMATPAVHLAVTIGFVLTGEGRSVCFAGDTYHRSFMKRIGAEVPLDVALLPVTTYRIPMTMGEKGAVKATRDLGARTVIPIHLALRPRSPLLRTRQSPEGFIRRLRDAGIGTDVVVLSPGDTWEA